MKKIIILNDGDVYGYIFGIFLLNSCKDINVEFIKLKPNKSFTSLNYLTPFSLDYFKKYTLDISDIDSIIKYDGTFSLNILLENFFSTDSNFFLTHDDLDFNVDVNQITTISKNIDIFELYYDSILASKLNVFNENKHIHNSYVTFSDNLFKDYIIQKCKNFQNFKYIQTDSLHYDIPSNNKNIYIDNTYQSILSKNVNYINDETLFSSYEVNEFIVDYDDIENELKNYINLKFESNKFIQTVFLYSKKIVTEYNFKNTGNVKNRINSHFIKDNVISIGKNFSNHNLSFLEQILNFYVMDKVINIIIEDDYRESKLHKINNEFQYIFKNLNYFVNNFLLFSKRNDSKFWKTFNSKEYYEKVSNNSLDLSIFYFSKNLYHLTKNIYFDYNFSSNKLVNNESLELLVYLNKLKHDREKFMTYSLLSQYRYLKKYVYKEKEDISFELFKNIV